ncbi:arylamine N-acetyltransferase [Priestia megaterium]|nr:arylamine N-acetyltransferase [Priestia megaterium]
MNSKYYFTRFLAKKTTVPTYENLEFLQEKHMLHVPFENLDVISKTPIITDLERIFEKVVINLRGGFCYELNGLFGWLLRDIGYNTYYVSATVKKPDGSWTMEGSHATNLVTVDGKDYIVDVGFGDSVRKPMPLTGEVITDISGSYRMMKLNETTYDFQHLEQGNWKTLYRVSTVEKELSDFAPMCDFNQTSPDSPFTHKRLVTIATKTGRTTLSDLTLTFTENGEKTKQEITEDQLNTILQQYFYIIMM